MGWPFVIVTSGGLPVTVADNGIGLPYEEATNGFGIAVTFVASGGLPVVLEGTATIQLSSATIAENASVGAVVGTLSVTNGSGTYTYTLTSNPGTLYAIDGGNLEVADTLSVGSDAITIEADNGVDTPISRAFLITVTAAAGGAPSMQFDDTANSQLLALLDDF